MLLRSDIRNRKCLGIANLLFFLWDGNPTWNLNYSIGLSVDVTFDNYYLWSVAFVLGGGGGKIENYSI